jgi:hypothetical protein
LRIPPQKPPIDHLLQTCLDTYVKKGVVFADTGRKTAAVIFSAMSFIFSVTQSFGERTLTIEFDGPPPQRPESGVLCTNYWEHLVSFDGGFTLRGAETNGLWPVNPTAFIQPAWDPVSCSRYDGSSFRLLSVDLAVYSDVFPDDPATFTGYRSDGSVVTTNFPVNSLIFKTYNFSEEFADLTNVLIQAGAVDNLKMVVPSIPSVLHLRTNGYSYYKWMTLTVNGTPEVPYRLEYTDILPATNWQTFTNFETSLYLNLDFPPTNPPHRFFRAVELP